MKTWSIEPGLKWRVVRWATQVLAFVAIIVGPILGGWQRGYRGTMSAWRMTDWDLPQWVIALLPDVPSTTVYEANQIVGGGTGVDYFGVPISDPVLGSIALLWGQNPLLSVVAWILPLVLALLFGRVFCGWFCPFGTLARGLDRLLSLLPFQHRGFEIPRQRPVRWALLALALVGGAFGGEILAVVFLPHALLQQATYALLLLGGLGAVGGALGGLLLAGIFFGPSLYCATLCPTGAALGFLGRRRVARVVVDEPTTCGSCTLCHRACWLGLRPAEGDPGPDCDLCTRCFSACPRSKMTVQLGRVGRAAALILVLGATVHVPAPAAASDWDNETTTPYKHTLVLHGSRETADYTVAATVVDLTGSQFTLDTGKAQGIELSVYVIKGNKFAVDQPGHRALDGEIVEGPVRVTIRRGDAEEHLEFARPTAPISTPNRTIYRRNLDARLFPGDAVAVEPIPGLFAQRIEFVVPEVRPARDGAAVAFLAAGLLVFGGLLSMALGFGKDAE